MWVRTSYIWMETNLKAQYDAKGITQRAGEAAAKVYDGQPYEILNELSGGIPYLDNSGKLSIMLERMEYAGFYAGETDITAIHISASEADAYYDNQFASKEALMVHEG